MSFYLELCIWSDAISQWIQQRNSIKFCANFRKSVMENLEMIRQAFWGRKHQPYMEVQTSLRPKKGKAGEYQSQEHDRHLFDIRGIVHEEFVPAGQTVNSAYYCEVLQQLHENSTQNLATKELAVASQHTISHFLFRQGIFDIKQHDCRPQPALLFSVFPFQNKN
jgi:hypothetical protein